MSPDWESYRERLADEPADAVVWEDAEDLARLSLEAFAGEFSPVRTDSSSGFLRLTGAGVDGHSARIDGVADMMHQFQRLVLATGAALEGHKSLRGQLPAQIVARTQLRLRGSALPGSLVLEVVPEGSPAAEIVPDGQPELFQHEEALLVDKAIGDAIKLMGLSKEVSADADDSEFLQVLQERGPRVATTLRDLASTLVQSQFDTDISWTQPRRARVRIKMAVAEMKHLGELVASREMAKEPIEMSGVLRTVSDLGPLKIETEEGIETVDAKNIDADTIKTLQVGMSVRVRADVTEDVTPGGGSTSRYTATSIESAE